MGKKGERKGGNRKPKPRVAVYAGAIGSGAVAAGMTGQGYDVPANIKSGTGLRAAALNVKEIVTDSSRALPVVAPAAIGIGVSKLADWLGVNRMLAKARLPFRI